MRIKGIEIDEHKFMLFAVMIYNLVILAKRNRIKVFMLENIWQKYGLDFNPEEEKIVMDFIVLIEQITAQVIYDSHYTIGMMHEEIKSALSDYQVDDIRNQELIPELIDQLSLSLLRGNVEQDIIFQKSNRVG